MYDRNQGAKRSSAALAIRIRLDCLADRSDSRVVESQLGPRGGGELAPTGGPAGLCAVEAGKVPAEARGIMTRPTQLTDMQLVLLATAIQRDDGSLLPAHNLNDSQGKRVAVAVADLIERGFAIEQATANPVQRRRDDGDTVLGLFITNVGRSAIDGEVTASLAPRPAKAQQSKSGTVRKLLSRTRGATIAEIAKVTGWQPHSIRAFLSSVRRTSSPLVREQRRSGEQAYRLAKDEATA